MEKISIYQKVKEGSNNKEDLTSLHLAMGRLSKRYFDSRRLHIALKLYLEGKIEKELVQNNLQVQIDKEHEMEFKNNRDFYNTEGSICETCQLWDDGSGDEHKIIHNILKNI